MSLDADIEFITSILPYHYEVRESKKRGNVYCRSNIGIPEDDLWRLLVDKLKEHFGNRLVEIYHNVCYLHSDFVVYLQPLHSDIIDKLGLKVCSGCGHLSIDIIPAGQACCPDSRYVPVREFIKEWHDEIVRVKKDVIELRKKLIP